MAGGSIEKRGEGSYRLTVTKIDPNTGERIRYRKNVKGSKTQAEKELVLFAAEVEKGEYLANTNNLTFKEFCEQWLNNYGKVHLAPKTLCSYEEQLNNRILPSLGKIYIKDLKPMHLIKFYNDLNTAKRLDGKEGTISGKTKLYIHKVISSILNDAVKWQVIPNNPAQRVEAPKAAKKKIEYYDEEQMMVLLQALQKEDLKWKTIVYIAIYTGMRRGEIMGLEWRDINFEKSTITIERSSQYVEGIGVLTKDPKNETSKREIAIPATLISLLNDYKIHQSKEKLKCGEKWQNTNRLFTTWNGEPMFPTSISHWFGKFIKDNELPHITFHGLRHTNATILINEGLNVKAISSRLGHANATTTLNIYAHSLKSTDKAAADCLENVFSNKKEQDKAKG